MYGKDILAVQQCQNRFAKLLPEVKESSCSGKPVAHALMERNMYRCVDSRDVLFKRQENEPFLERDITRDDK